MSNILNENLKKIILLMKFVSFSFIDATKSVIYGTEPLAALDSDKFSEISLDQPVDAEITTSQPQEYNPLQNLDLFSPASSTEPQQQRDENTFNPLAQATAIKDSLSQLPGVLPGVASSVFSSFSSILKGRTSPNPAVKDSYATIDPNYSGQLPEGQENTLINQYQCFYDQSIQQQQQDIPPIAPTFYSPTDLQRPEASLSPSSDNQSSNLYRLKERKKLYAPIPGLNANQSNPIQANPIQANPIQQNPIQSHPSASPSPGFNQPPPVNSTAQNNSFSLSSFFSGAVDKVLPKQSEDSVNQEPPSIAQPFIYSPPEPQASPATQFFNPNQFASPDPFYQAPQSTGDQLPPSSQAPFSVSTSSLPLNVAVTQQVAPPPPTSFNLNPFQKSSQPVEKPTQHSAQFFNPNQFSDSNLQQSKPLASPHKIIQPSVSPIIASPSQESNIVQQSVAASSPFVHSPFQKPPTPQPPASTSPALVQQSAIPSSYLPPSSVPLSGQSVSYRLKGKALYRKPIQSTPFLPNQPANPTSAQFFNPVTSNSPPTSNFQIFNPLAFNSSQQQPVEQQITSTTIPQIVPTPFLSAESAQIPSAQTTVVTGISSVILPSVEIQSTQITPIQFSSQPITQAESIAPPPVSIFNPFSEQSTNLDSKINQLESSPVTFAQNYQATAPPPSPPSITPNNPFQTINTNSAITNLEPIVPVQFDSFFEKDNLQLNVSQPLVEKSIENHTNKAAEENVIETELPSTLITTPPVIQNFFQSTPFDPFQQNQNNFNVENTVSQPLNDNNANIDQVNAAIENLSFDKENNTIEKPIIEPQIEITDYKTVETSTFDPISFFNNNLTEPQDTSNVIEYQIQNFFSEPPPLTEVQENVQEKNFNFIRTNLLNKRIERIANAETASPETLSIASVIAEPASSAQSETSYIEQPAVDLTEPSLSESLQTTQVNCNQLTYGK